MPHFSSAIITFFKCILDCFVSYLILFIRAVSAATPPNKPRGRPRLNATISKASASHTAVSGALNAIVEDFLPSPAKRTSRVLSS